MPLDGEITLPAGVELVNGRPYMADAKGKLTPLEMIKTEHRLEDELVRKIMDFAEPLAAQVARFREHTFDDVDGFVALLEQEYGVSRGGQKGNLTFTSYDGLMRVQVQVSDLIEFGPQLQIAKTHVDACLSEWSADSRPEIRAVVTRAFNVDKAGLVNKAELFSLLRLEIQDARWQEAMKAIRNAIRVVGSKRYVRIHKRANPQAPWEHVSIDVASA